MIRFSANLGFLWTDLRLPDAIRAAGEAGFDAVECHMPYETDSSEIVDALTETGLAMISLNTRLGGRPNDFGVAAIPGREDEARSLIEEAVAYAASIGCGFVHVLAGRTDGSAEAQRVYQSNLAHAAACAADAGQRVLIEPLNSTVVDYHLTGVVHAVDTVEAVGSDNLRIMIDCFHSRMMDGSLDDVFDRAWPYLGHIQISAHPDRGEPVGGDIDYHELLPALAARGWDEPFGAEYTPRRGVAEGLGWLTHWHEQRRNDS